VAPGIATEAPVQGGRAAQGVVPLASPGTTEFRLRSRNAWLRSGQVADFIAFKTHIPSLASLARAASFTLSGDRCGRRLKRKDNGV
jgi:hypothetical protein